MVLRPARALLTGVDPARPNVNEATPGASMVAVPATAQPPCSGRRQRVERREENEATKTDTRLVSASGSFQSLFAKPLGPFGDDVREVFQ